MKLEVTKEAAEWYISELDLNKGDFVQFVVKIYGGIPTVHQDYYLGISIGKEGNVGIKDEVEGITFYFTDEDSWFLKDHDMKVVLKDEDVDFIFENKA
ncbi:hypothetical protein [Bacillus sp. FJAT-49736]|uniref:HesB/YadR/YfhF family protein n=1 Tax=Bacillus sp. FJAT-49736 TaxID=2833582 RepID=UPI001BC96FD5|nr:hypothetical protein [Bacillus sp. FJAT-49736]MBS4174380.1 hypothetical protein [Bacillus sp. FJAT-49736]